MTKTNDTLSFRVSAGLKNLIGRDLISDKYIAVFELVKNSYDAGASKVEISYLVSDEGAGKIIISDNGSGMTYNDIIQKWLFVAYSEKKPQNRSKSTYREEIKREVAGAKGVGRFSCDRLGASLQLITKTKKEIQAHRKSTDNVIELTKGNFIPIDEELHQKMRKNLTRYNQLIEKLEKFVTEKI